MAVTIGLGPRRVSLQDLARAHEVQIGDEHRSTLADCTVLARIRDCCDDLETCLLSSRGWTKPQRQDKTLETPQWSRSRAVGRSSPDRAQERPQAVLKPGSGLR